MLAIPAVRLVGRVRKCLQIRRYGAGLRYAMSILSNADRWADMVEILGLAVDADIRRSRCRRVTAFVTGEGQLDRRAVRYIPVVVKMNAQPYGLAVTVIIAPGQSRDDWIRRSRQLSAALRVERVVVVEPRPGVVELQLRVRDPLRALTVLSEPLIADGWRLPLGVDERGVLVAGACRNVSGVVVGGVPGGGKSAWLSMALASLARREDVQWLLIDGKQGYDLEPLASRAYRYISGDEAGDLEVVKGALQDVQELMRCRLRCSRDLFGESNLWSAGPSTTHPVVVVVIDECQTYLDGKSFPTRETKATGAEIDSIVRDLVKRGRSAGIIVILSTQRPTADSIPTSTRDNCGLRVCFSVRTREAAAAVLGEFSTESDISPIGAPTGVGVSSVDGVEVRFRAPYVPDPVLRRHLKETAHLVSNPLELLSRALMDLASAN
ncbi:hypothetical protein A5727_23620 [Mycobacterium sp. ACS4331]|nr:hypothetical protein A5727_23620 [Mycobacterium sp. ACS4331]